MKKQFLMGLLLGAGWLGALGAEAKPYTEAEGRRPWYTFVRPAKKTPEDQLAYARELAAKNRLRLASRACRALTASWPSSPEAGAAQLDYARLLDRRGKAEKAFEAYQKLLDRYPGSFPLEEVLQRQYALAERLMTERKARFLFGGFRASERAIPLFQKIVETAPQWEKSPEAQYQVGQAYEMNNDLAEAAAAYTEALYRFPNSPVAEAAAYRRADCLFQMTKRSPNDGQLAEDAWFAMALFIRQYPNADKVPAATEARDALYLRRARNAYNKALYYDKMAKKPENAISPYEVFLNQFPESEWAPAARERLTVLKKQKESADEKPTS